MSDTTYIVGIETSCDETSCAVVADGQVVLSNVVASQIDLHARFGGVVPELASRAHIEAINNTIQRALDEGRIAPADISAVAVANEHAAVAHRGRGVDSCGRLVLPDDHPGLQFQRKQCAAFRTDVDR